MTEPVTPPLVVVSPVGLGDLAAISDLHARVFGPGRFTRTAYRVREGTAPVSRFCLKALLAGRLVAVVRFTEITIGGSGEAAMLGPLAVEPAHAGLGYGKRLVAEGVAACRRAGLGLVVLVGNEPYYGRFGFKQLPPGRIWLPGPVEPGRLLAAGLQEGAGRLAGLVAAAPVARLLPDGTRPQGT